MGISHYQKSFKSWTPKLGPFQSCGQNAAGDLFSVTQMQLDTHKYHLLEVKLQMFIETDELSLT